MFFPMTAWFEAACNDFRSCKSKNWAKKAFSGAPDRRLIAGIRRKLLDFW